MQGAPFVEPECTPGLALCEAGRLHHCLHILAVPVLEVLHCRDVHLLHSGDSGFRARYVLTDHHVKRFGRTKDDLGGSGMCEVGVLRKSQSSSGRPPRREFGVLDTDNHELES